MNNIGEEVFHITTEAPEQTMKFAEKLAHYLQEGNLILLEGDLGAGKTTFTKGLAKGLGVTRNVNSPTFTIIKEYQGEKLPLYHMDVYRLGESMEDLGFDEYFEGNGVTVVEWAHLIEDQLPLSRLEIELYHREGDKREICLKAKGSEYIDLCKEFIKDENISN
ncbi:tRNA (adenosine(37)-N6)-threonylcarbamoyltransferase complex ATPase subunit type 1 TsaE [Priestia endophytica]|uniref:tRNA threonylcarbamoyladenosine biosynthesis protein TsaE n=1 Tax=Priestia endophytica TaxID=135735 RepID=A0AAX1Q7L0_9BACI|nr:tRNA (adenosine(37)-N6)-threonylcarbamoyltransferase complex ATPase subunit type 1 TsaE [Priestia endophytica]RAS75726.1 tRNA (adenosine(37)-N6)-threonylcarbamoyltransferase complex ATPase subunit type 1 TsaE [Priestia endophytica]RAS92499.1 tRNA (adenosine(37)-N6)-threonylcarbamoyltransferase complex ATPase subunit type 1 TsaE [Priestia endophytica]